MVQEQSGQTSQSVRSRRVFYIPGYDPIHPRRYRELYRKEAAAQAEISGYDIDLKAKTTNGPYGWHVSGTFDSSQIDADVEVLVWSDIVRDSMSNTIPATYLQLVSTAWTYITTGALFRLMRLRKGPVIAALYPVAALVLQLLLAIVLGAGIGFAVARSVEWAVNLVTGSDGGAMVAALGFFLTMPVITWMVLRWFKAKDGKVFAYYLMHDYAYSARYRGANPAQLETRMAAFGDLIAEALTTDVDEVLIVGHSSGAHLGVSVLADLIRAGRVPDHGPALGFLSLGQVVPMVSFLPDAHRLRGDLQFLSTQEELTWIDVSAPGDGCAFALCDPVGVSGVAPEGKLWPLVMSAAFTQTLSAERWAELRWRFFRLHFQYLCAFDRPGDYDYFLITVGPITLRDRFNGRPPSKSRIEHSVSKYTSVAP